MKNFKILTEDEEKNLTNDELIDYYIKLKSYYKSMSNTQKFIQLKKFIHPLLLTVMRTTVKSKMKLFRELPKFEGPAIFAVNHTNSHDVPAVSDVIKEHCYILAGSENLRLIDRIMFNLNGVIFINRKDKKCKKKSKDKVIKLLTQGNNLLIFPEGTWNTSENKIMLPLNWGIVEIAKKADVPVIPIALEYMGDVYHANVGEPIKFDVTETKLEGINRLRDVMATLRWQIWEKYGQTTRNKISWEAFNLELENAFNEYKQLDREYEQQVILKNEDSYEEVFKHLKTINYNINNAFLLGKNKK